MFRQLDFIIVAGIINVESALEVSEGPFCSTNMELGTQNHTT